MRVRRRRARAATDPRTQLAARASLTAQLEARLAEAKRHERTFTTVAIEIDGFQHMRETYGELSANRVVAGLGRLVAARFRSEDLRGHFENIFVLGFSGYDAASIAPALQRLQDEFGTLVFRSSRGSFRSSFSAGIASFPEAGTSLKEVIAKTEARLDTTVSATHALVWRDA